MELAYYELHSTMKRTIDQVNAINEFEDQVVELAKKLYIRRKDFNKDIFTGAIRQALFTVTNKEIAIVQAEFLASIPKGKEQ